MERGGAVRVRDASGQSISFSSWGEQAVDSSKPPSGRSKRKTKGKAKVDYAPGSDVFRCKACNKDCSGVVSFAQHCQGKSHAAQAGHFGFAGLIPNVYGLVPELSPEFLQQNPKSQTVSVLVPTGKCKEPAVQKVAMSLRNEKAVRAALHRSASAGSLEKQNAGIQATRTNEHRASPLMHKSLSEGKLQSERPLHNKPKRASTIETGPLQDNPSRSFWCNICMKDLESEQSFAQHKAGRKHKDRELKAQQEHQHAPRNHLPPPPTHSPAHPRKERISRRHDSPMETAGDIQITKGIGLPPHITSTSTRPNGSNHATPTQSGLGRLSRASRSHMPTGPPPALVARGPMTEQREALPAAAYRSAIIDLLDCHQVLVVEGETGCGKTTQVPQFILEEAASKGLPANVICTQPRRISAMAVAERIACERGEVIGNTVGYTIRLQSKVSPSTHLLFCTTGILLRRLEGDPNLEGVTHVLVDEVHERSIESDFLLMVLRDLLKRNKTLRLCLMSATLDVNMFCNYFGGAPSLSIPGRTFPVATMWLEDALQITRHVVKPGAEWARKGDGGKRPRGNGNPNDNGLCYDFLQGRCTRGAMCRFSHGNKVNSGTASEQQQGYSVSGTEDSSYFAGVHSQGTGSYFQIPVLAGRPQSRHAGSLPDDSLDDAELSEEQLRARYGRYDPGVSTALAKLDPSSINYELIMQILQWVLHCGGPTAASDWARRQHGDSSTGGQLKEVHGGAADKAWDEDSDNSGDSEIPDDWEAGDFDNLPTSVKAAVSDQCPTVAAPDGPADAVLVFLPGLKEIQHLQELLLGMAEFGRDPQRSWILPLHSSVPPEEQRMIFQHAPAGIYKIVLATNIAETAITIDDVGFVIDSGRMKENRYDPMRRMASLEDVLVSQANARQRRGRAGRVRPGAAIHLITSHRHNSVAAAQQAPEVQRVPLEQLVLQIKALQYARSAAEVCAQLIEPPLPSAVNHAVAELVRLEALQQMNDQEVLTPLGTHLSKLPVDVRIGKLLLLGAIFDVPDECLTIAAALSYRSPFLSPLERREEADCARQQFRFGQSDHLSTLFAYMEWDSLGKGERRYNWARENFLGVKTLQMIASLKRQLLELLSEAGFVRPGLRCRTVESLGRRDGSDGCRIALMEGRIYDSVASDTFSWLAKPRLLMTDDPAAREGGERCGRTFLMSQGSDVRRTEMVNVPLLQALLCAALYPQVMTVEYPKQKPGKTIKPESLKFRIREEGQTVPTEVALHPSSINSKVIDFHSNYLVYHERVKTTRIYVRDCTPVSPYALMLFGGALAADECAKPAQGRGKGKGVPRNGDPVMSVDGWIKFSVPEGIPSLLLDVRKSLDELLKQKIERPDIDLGGHREVIDAVVQLICTQ